MNERAKSVVVIVALVATLVVNALASLLPLAGRSTGEISDLYPVLFTPAGYVFSIWSLIYLGLIAFAVYQALPRQRNNPRLARIRWPFVLSCVFNIAWLFAWHYLLISLSIFLMLGLLGSLITIYERLGTGQVAVRRTEFWLARVAFSLYLGWITVATVANASVVFYDLGWREGEQAWTVVAIALATGIAATVMARRHDVVFVLVPVWALVGIAVANWGIPLVVNAALLAAILLLAWIVYHLLSDPPEVRRFGV